MPSTSKGLCHRLRKGSVSRLGHSPIRCWRFTLNNKTSSTLAFYWVSASCADSHVLEQNHSERRAPHLAHSPMTRQHERLKSERRCSSNTMEVFLCLRAFFYEKVGISASRNCCMHITISPKKRNITEISYLNATCVPIVRFP